jgi:hypothetical protein
MERTVFHLFPAAKGFSDEMCVSPDEPERANAQNGFEINFCSVSL